MSADTKRDGFKLLGDHVDGCLCVRKYDGGKFIVHDGMLYNRRRNGDRGGSTCWHRFRCNDTNCNAILLVRWDTLANFIDPPEPDCARPDGASRPTPKEAGS